LHSPTYGIEGTEQNNHINWSSLDLKIRGYFTCMVCT
jgi:hypothetical protein